VKEMAELKLRDILPLLKNKRSSKNGYTSRCPSHDDNKNSLSLSEGENGKLILNCFAGCSYKDVIVASGVSLNGNEYNAAQKEIEAAYNYTDEHGKLLYQNVRFKDKNFRQRHFDESGREVWNLKDVRRVPYRLPELIKTAASFEFVLAEGEKDADKLSEKGLGATNHKNWKSEFNYLLKSKKVVIFQDHDRAGVVQGKKAAQIIFRDAETVKIVDCFADEPLPEKHGKDVSDYLEKHSVEELLELISATPNWTPLANKNTYCESGNSKLKVTCLTDVKAEKPIWLWKPFIAIGEFTILEGIEGIGKSWIGCALACAVADGKKLPFSESEPIEPANVLMLSAEDSLGHTIKPRLLSMQANLNRIFALEEVFSLDNPKDLIEFEAVIAEYQPKLVIIDPIFSYTGGRNLNQESESRPLAGKLIAIAKRFQCSIVGVRHIGKSRGNGDARAAGLGSTAWRASARSVLLVGNDAGTNEKAICQTKNNLCEQSKISIGFQIVNDQFFWNGEPSKLTEERMLAQPKDNETKAEQVETVAFLSETLRDGERPSIAIIKEARELGITNYALRKARQILGVECFKKGGNFGGEKGWFMRLPITKEDIFDAEDTALKQIQHLQTNQSNKTSYDSYLAEDVEPAKNQHLQKVQTIYSSDLILMSKPKEKCKCGQIGVLGENCQNCNETIIPF
jgi:putative DNA primase/helicase